MLKLAWLPLMFAAINVWAARSLTLEVYNPGTDSIFPVSSEIISGDHEVVLIDAQFQRNDAQALVKKIQATGKTLTTIYISHSDPDYYFGLDVIKSAFPRASIVATQETVNAIAASRKGKLAYWQKVLKENAPHSIPLPQPLKARYFTVDGQKLEIKGNIPDRTWVWIPSLRAVVGGVAVFGDNIHPWLADTQSVKSRADWLQTLEAIQKVNPDIVVPGHFLPGAAQTLASVTFTQGYLTAAEKALSRTKDGDALITSLRSQYPNLKDESSLEISAKVLKGEMKWPQ